jgi:NADH-quinone oxidoreductase subunit F
MLKAINEVAGGMRGGKKLKAVVPGGSSCPLLKADECDIAMDYDTLAKVGSMLGSGGMVVMDETPHGEVRAAHHALLRARKLRLVHPVPRGHHLAAKILHAARRRRHPEDIPLLGELSKNMLGRTFCALGDAAAMPTISIVEKFADDFEAFERHACPYDHARRNWCWPKTG